MEALTEIRNTYDVGTILDEATGIIALAIVLWFLLKRQKEHNRNEETHHKNRNNNTI